MGYSQENGYTPNTLTDIMDLIMAGVNEQFGTSYTESSFVGTNFYKFFYVLAQRVQENEVKLSEVFLKLQDYFDYTNETIIDPKVTPNGLIAIFAEAGYVASIKAPILADAGKVYICIDVDETDPDYATIKLALCEIIKDYSVAGVITQGTESETLVLTNGQSFDFKYNLPSDTETYLKLTLTTSRNNQGVIPSTDDIKQTLLDNINARYGLGKDFEPDKYFTPTDAPYAADILLEYSFDDVTYYTAVYEADYDELLDIDLTRLTLIQS